MPSSKLSGARGRSTAGGFGAFLAGGQRSLNLTPADPALPFAASVALATGAAPGANGVVGARYRPPGAEVNEIVEIGGDHPLAGTLWDVAGAADRVVGAVLWPGLDNRDDARRATWGVADTDTEHYPARPFVLARNRWVDDKYGIGPGPSVFWGLPPEVKSFSTPLNVSAAFAPHHSRAELIYVLVAIDRTDDGVVNYDGLLVSSRIDPKKGFVGIAEPGEWFRLELVDPSGSRRASPEVVWVKVQQLAPDLSRSVIYISASRFIKAFPSALVRKLDGTRVSWPGRPDEEVVVAGESGGYGIDARTFAEMAERLAAYAVDVSLAGLDLYPTDLLLVSIPVFDPIDRRLLLVRSSPARLRCRARGPLPRGSPPALGGAGPRSWRGCSPASTSPPRPSSWFRLTPTSRSTPTSTSASCCAWRPSSATSRPRRTGPGAQWPPPAASRTSISRSPGGTPAACSRLRARAGQRAPYATCWRARATGSRSLFERVLLREEAAALGLDRPESGDVIVFARPGYRLVESSMDLVAVTRRPDVHAAAGYAASLAESRGFLLTLGRGVEAGKADDKARVTDVAGRVARAIGIKLPKRAR